MLRPELVCDLEHFGATGCYRPPMLMLGAQQSVIPGVATARAFFARWVGEDGYDELDMNGLGTLRLDLNADLAEIAGAYATVFNLGTIEHVWNVHNAWSNALRAVELGGIFLTHTPIAGWRDKAGAVDHGLHMTLRSAIEEFITGSGFAIREAWTSHWRERGDILWLRAEKLRHIDALTDFKPPMQVYGY